MKPLLRLLSICAVAALASPVQSGAKTTPVLGTATFIAQDSVTSITARIDALGPLDLMISGSPELGLTVATGNTFDIDQFATVLSVANGEPAWAPELLDDAIYASFTLLEVEGKTRIQLLVAEPRKGTEADIVFSSVFGISAPADFELIQGNIASNGNHVFRLYRPWRKAAVDLTNLLKGNGYLVYEMPGSTDTLVFAERAGRALVLFIQNDPNGDATRVVVNLKE